MRKPYTFNRTQAFLAELAGTITKLKTDYVDLSQLMVITTNYDSGLEKAFEERGLSIDVVYYFTGAHRGSGFYHKRYEIQSDGHYPFCRRRHDNIERVYSTYDKFKFANFGTKIEIPIIIKLHGGVVYRSPMENDTFMISETHQIDFFRTAKSTFPAALKNYLDCSDIAFLGYTANDADLRAILHYLFGNKKYDSKFFRKWHEYTNHEDKDIPKGWLVTQSPLEDAGKMNNGDYWGNVRIYLIECNCNDFVYLFHIYLAGWEKALSFRPER